VAGFQGDALKKRMNDATREFIKRLTLESPLVVVFDDLHWSDAASLDLLLNVVDLSTEQPILFICLSRPEKRAVSWDLLQTISDKLGDNFYPVELAPLQAEQTEILLNNLLDANELPKAIRDLIVSKGEGNPFFIEEVIRSLIETNQIVRENDQWKAVGDEAKISLPNTLRGVLSARVDRLPEASKSVLQDASVIGRLFDLRVLKRLTGLNGGLDPHIQYLTEVSLIEALIGEYAFRHVLIQEATYESILMKKRAGLHRQIGETMEELYAGRIEEFAPLLAYHFYSAGDERSLKYDLMAGKKSAQLYANADAIVHFSRALEVAKHVTIENDRLTDIYIQLGQSHELSGHFDQALATYDDLQTNSVERKSRSMELKALIARATIYSTLTPVYNPSLGEIDQKQALELANELGDISSQAKLHWGLMLNYLFSNRLPEAVEHCEPTVALARQINDPDQLAFTLNDAGRVYQGSGAFEKSFAAFNEANDLWTKLGNQVMLADNLGASSLANYMAGEYDKALSFSEQAWEISRKTDNHWGQSYSRVAQTYVYFDRGLLDFTIQFANECIDTGEKGGLVASLVLIPVELAWLYGLYGETSQGIELAEKALAYAAEKMPDWKSPALAVLSRLHILTGNVGAAEKIISSEELKPILAVIYPRYLTMIKLVFIELELARKNYQTALSLSDELLEELSTLTWINKPEILYRRADALIGLGRLDKAHQSLTEACSLAEKLDAKHHLWPILSSLSNVNAELGNRQQADNYRKQAREVVGFIAERLKDVRLKKSFLNQPRVQKLMRD
jgi:predicted ATPase